MNKSGIYFIRNAANGKKLSEEHRAKIRASLVGHKVSEPARAKISTARRLSLQMKNVG